MSATNIPLCPPDVLDPTSRGDAPEAATKLATGDVAQDQRFPHADDAAMATLVMLADEAIRRARGESPHADDAVAAIDQEAAVAAYQFARGERERSDVPAAVFCDVLRATAGSVALTLWDEGFVRVCRVRLSDEADSASWASDTAAVGTASASYASGVDLEDDATAEAPRGPYLAVTHHGGYTHDLGAEWGITAEWLTRADVREYVDGRTPDFIATERCFRDETLAAIDGASPTAACDRIVRDEQETKTRYPNPWGDS